MSAPCLEQHQRAETFLNRTRSWLEEREPVHDVILGTVVPRTAGEEAREIRYLATVTAGDTMLAAAQAHPWRLAVAARDEPPEGAFELLVRDLAARASARGFFGEAPTARALAAVLPPLLGRRPQLAMDQRLLMARRVRAPAGSLGRLRRADPAADGPLVERWVDGFQVEALGASDSADARRKARRRLERREVHLWELDGIPVSMAGEARPTPRGITVNLVYTPPDNRGRGYASACVAALSCKLLERREYCVLFTDRSNETSNRIYERIGYEPICDFEDYVLQGGFSDRHHRRGIADR